MTGPAPLGYSPLYGRVGVEQRLRSRIGFIQLEDRIAQRKTLQTSDLQELMFAERVYAAELVLPDLLPACAVSQDATVVQACSVLRGWDRKANVDSRGALLFREFWNIATTLPNKWAVPFNAADPVHTPAGVAPAAVPAMLAAIKTAATKLQGLGIPLDAMLGDYQADTRNGVRVPLHGGLGDVDGAYNSIRWNTDISKTGYNNPYWGASYIQTVTFDANGPQAQGMLVYGQSTDPTSPYYADQIGVYARKEWPALPFTQEKIKADPAYKMITLSQ
jgi:acyl-homoserine-lactone acylase